MMRKADLCVLLLAASASCGCSQTHAGGSSSQAQFLQGCSDDECGAGLTCLCGVCSHACENDTTCRGLSANASCIQAEYDSCEQVTRCDVTCKNAADCRQFGASYDCEKGRCREPEDAVPVGGGPARPPCGEGGCDAGTNMDAAVPRFDAARVSTPAELEAGTRTVASADGGTSIDARTAIADDSPCGQPAFVERMLGGPAPENDCGQLTLPSSSDESVAALDCVRAAAAMQQPFQVSWQRHGIDSELHDSIVSVRDGSGAATYHVAWDSSGFGGGLVATWSPCQLTLIDDCNDSPAHCMPCTDDPKRSCTCTQQQAGPNPFEISCSYDVPARVFAGNGDFPLCRSGSCEFDGVCYPSGATTEDGCCSCDQGQGSCIEPGWCPGWLGIGKRCDSDADCARTPGGPSSGLECRKDFVGEKGLCTRACNYGCPTGTLCASNVPAYDATRIGEVCMRSCLIGTSNDCSELGSECVRLPISEQPYCL